MARRRADRGQRTSLRLELPASVSLAGLVISGLLVSGCGHRETDPVATAPTPPPIQARRYPASAPGTAPNSGPSPVTQPIPSVESTADASYVAAHQPIYSEEGVASWYGPPYHNRIGANGQVFDQNAKTAAHRTLPMGSLIVVTNEKTGQSAMMRITDRGPFVQGRLLDLSKASAQATGVYLPGVAKVRVDVYETPRPMEKGGRWCVQIGAFEHEHKAEKLRDQLEREYETANVIDFSGPTGYWVRIRPQGDNRQQAELIQRRLSPVEGDAYLVRLD